MAIKSSRNLGDICRQTPVKHIYRILSLDEARQEFGSRSKRRVYYVGTTRNGAAIFGIVGTGHMVSMPHNLYDALGNPNADREIPFRRVFETYRLLKKYT